MSTPPVADWPFDVPGDLSPAEAEAVLGTLAGLYLQAPPDIAGRPAPGGAPEPDEAMPILEARYRTLLEQISAIVFMAYLDRGIGEAYVSPQIERTLGFSQAEWLEDPIRWYQQIHPDDKPRWGVEAARMFLSGEPLRSVYRVLARDGHVVWFHCEARMVRHEDGRPWFIQGVAFDITDLKVAEAALQDERNVLSAILDTAGALVVVLTPAGSIIRFNRACEALTGRTAGEVAGRYLWELFMAPEEVEAFRHRLADVLAGRTSGEYETSWTTPGGARRIAWSSTVLRRPDGAGDCVIKTGIDITERQRLQRAVLEIGDQAQRRIGQDLHDGLGQHLTGIAFMSKVLAQKLADAGRPEAGDASKILRLVNEAIHRTRELTRGMVMPVSGDQGLAAALGHIASDVEDLFRVTCRFDCEAPVAPVDVRTATHLCNIAREAINNAIRHGRAREIVIGLATAGRSGRLTIRDDGIGVGAARPNADGMGLRIMRYRAGMIGGSLRIDDASPGTLITCRFPVRDEGRS